MSAFDTKVFCVRPLRQATSARALQSWQSFRRQEDGVLAVPVILIILLMLMVGGIGIDLMRYERDRTELQYTLDRAVLAAADLDQQFHPNDVVRDYLEKSGLGEHYQDPYVDMGQGYRKVEATVTTPFTAQYLRLAGDPGLTLKANARAEESIDDIEISLVLDVSGSMNSNNRLPNLKIAAKEFVDAIGLNTIEGKMSMSIVPYATQVSVPDELFAEFNVDELHAYSNCINFDASDFDQTDLTIGKEYEQTLHFSPWYSSDYRASSGLVQLPVCDDRALREILPLQQDPQTLKSFIENLQAGGNTSIDLGMKWGTLLLDDSLQPTVQSLTTGESPFIDPEFATRPAAYSDTETLKIIVLMTDGQNTSQYFIRDQFREAQSGVWYNSQENRYSTYDPNTGEYYWDGLGRWEDHPYGNGTYRSCNYYGCSTKDEPGTAEQLSYIDLWARTHMRFVSERLYADWMGYNNARNTYYYGAFTSVGHSSKNTRTANICDAAKDEGIVVYTIGFEAPESGQAVLRNCASSDAHFFDVEGLEISDAFASIATSIRQLRLTQ